MFSENELFEIRKQFPVTHHYIYFNHCSVAPISQNVFDSLAKISRSSLEHGYVHGEEWRNQIEETRQNAAKLLRCKKDEIAFVKNTSHGISLVAKGLNWKAGDEIVLSDEEFPSNVFPWESLKNQGVKIVRLPDAKIESFRSALNQKTRLITISSVQYSSGFVCDLEDLIKLCQANGTLIFLDAIQSLGVLDLDLSKTPVDFLAADAHKWLLGPEGIGLFYLRKELCSQIEPPLLGWSSVENNLSFDNQKFKLHDSALRFEEGSPPSFLIAALGASLKFILEIGIHKIEQHVLELKDFLEQGIQDLNYEIHSSKKSPTLAFSSKNKNWAPEKLENYLLQNKVIASGRRNNFRLAPHFYNNQNECEKILSLIKTFTQNL